jgi:hypothetical protein
MDPNFSINANSLSYDDTKAKGAILSLQMNMQHSHSCGWNPKESYRFADSVVKGGKPLTTCVTEPGTSRNISFKIKKPADATKVTAKAYYLTEPMSYSMDGAQSDAWKVTSIDQTWSSIPCTVSGDTITGTLPASAKNFYVEITTVTSTGTYITSTRYIESLS